MNKKPPKTAEILLEIFLKSHLRDAHIGDFEEIYNDIYKEKGVFKANLWYWSQVFKSFPGVVLNSVFWSFAMFKNYLKITVRNVKRRKTFHLINIFGLTLGLTCCFLITMWIYDEKNYDSYHHDVDRIFRVVADVKANDDVIRYASTPSSLSPALIGNFPQVEYSGRFMSNPEIIVKSDQNQGFYEKKIFHTDPDIFKILKIPFIHGDPQKCLEDPDGAVITESAARKYFGSNNCMGKYLNFGYKKFRISGIVEDCRQNSSIKFNILLSLRPFDKVDWTKQGWTDFDGQQGLTYTYIKLKDNINLNELKKQILNISQRYTDEASGQSYYLQPITEIHLNPDRKNEPEKSGSLVNIRIFTAAAVLMLLTAVLNFIKLTTARYASRAKEVGIRKVIGAERFQLVKQFYGETFFLISLSACLSVLFLIFLFPFFNDFSGKFFHIKDIFNITTMSLFVLIVTVTILLSGSYPALMLSSFSPVKVLIGKFSSLNRSSVMRKTLVIIQFSTTVILIFGVLIIYRQLQFMKNENPGFNRHRLLALPVPIGSLFSEENAEMLKNEFSKHHSVESVTPCSSIPGQDEYIFCVDKTLLNNKDTKAVRAYQMMAGYDFLNTYGVGLLAGRNFNREMKTDRGGACLINETAVRAFGLNSPEEATGKILKDFKETEIIGVFSDFFYQSFHEKIEPLVIEVNYDFFMYLILNIDTNNLTGTLDFIKNKWEKLFPEVPVSYHFLDDIYNSQYSSEDQLKNTVFMFSVLTIFVASLGLFGLSLYMAELKTREIAVRKIFGASVSRIFRSLAFENITLVLISNIIALPAAFFLAKRWLENFAYRINIGWAVFVIAGILTLLIAVFTVSFQSLKAARTNPVDSLKYE